MGKQSALGIIAGNGIYPFLVARAARQRGVTAIHIAAFENETRPELASMLIRSSGCGLANWVGS